MGKVSDKIVESRAIYHAMNRGDYSERVFRDARDPELFLATLAEACAKTDWQVREFCVMSNHFHLVIETPRANLVPGILSEDLRQRGWDLEELKNRSKGDPDKIEIARRLRTQTIMTLAWIAQHLSMGAAGSLADCLRNNTR